MSFSGSFQSEALFSQPSFSWLHLNKHSALRWGLPMRHFGLKAVSYLQRQNKCHYASCFTRLQNAKEGKSAYSWLHLQLVRAAKVSHGLARGEGLPWPPVMEAAVLEAFNAQYKQPLQSLAAGASSARIVTKAERAEGQKLWENFALRTGAPCWPSEGLGCWPELRQAGTWTYGCCLTEHCWGLWAELSPEPSAEQRSADSGSTYSFIEDFFLWPFTKKDLSAPLIVVTSVPYS